MAAGERRAAKLAGESRYFTGRPCKHGHVADRETRSGKCLGCKMPSSANFREYNTRWALKHPGRMQEVKYRFRYGVELSDLPPKPDLCEICGGRHPKIVLDHCHATGLFRGWLCDRCNRVLGSVNEDPNLLRQIAEYCEIPSEDRPVRVFLTRNGHGKPFYARPSVPAIGVQ
jgi:hypothetical protein